MRNLLLILALFAISACGPASSPIPNGSVPQSNDTSWLAQPASQDFDYLENKDGEAPNLEIQDPIGLNDFYGPTDFFQYFDMHVVVNKASKGKTAQTLRVFIPSQSSAPIYTWPVSTGREKVETAPSGRTYKTSTPTGVFIMGPLTKEYYSKLWDNAPMPYAMFLKNPNKRHLLTGFAIHGIVKSKEKHLGERASGGCVRVATRNAKTLFELIQAQFRRPIPIFQLLQMKGGLIISVGEQPQFERGYSVLVRIINDPT